MTRDQLSLSAKLQWDAVQARRLAELIASRKPRNYLESIQAFPRSNPIRSAGSFTLNYPPSANRYWRMGRGHIHKSNEAKAYQETAARMALAAGVRPLKGDVQVQLNVFRPARRGDLDNTIKVLLDALKGVAYADDDQVVGITARRFDDKMRPRVEVFVTRMEA